MRQQLKFRGFSNETKSWHYGHGWFEIDYTDEYLKEKGINQQAMLYTEGYPVECELSSIGQYTGLNDASDEELYEGDILLDTFPDDCYEVVWDDYGMFLYCKKGGNEGIDRHEFEEQVSLFVVSGNIHNLV